MSRIGDNGGPPLRDGNWIAVSRDLIEHHIVGAGQVVPAEDKNRGSFSRLEAWLDLLCLANFKDRQFDVRGLTIALTPGETLAGREFLAKRWNWSEKTVRVWLERLERELMITLAVASTRAVKNQLALNSSESETGQKPVQYKGRFPNVLTICNWWKFQPDTPAPGPLEGPVEGQLRASRGPDLNKETKEQRNKREDVSAPPALVADATPAPLEALRAFEAYNALALRIGLQQSRTLTPARRKALCARLREHGPESWSIALTNVERSAFLRGNNSRQWRANFDFLLQAASYAKVVDGTYGNGAHGDTLKPTETQSERMARLMRQISEGEQA